MLTGGVGIVATKTPVGGTRFLNFAKVGKALLSLFNGSLVEGSFNIIDDINEKDRVRVNTETHEVLAGKTASDF